VLAFENTGAVARQAASQAIVRREEIDPDSSIAALDAVSFDEVREIARRVDPQQLAIACVGPHNQDDFKR
jgi:predicted Zn-dependent peptidase